MNKDTFYKNFDIPQSEHVMQSDFNCSTTLIEY